MDPTGDSQSRRRSRWPFLLGALVVLLALLIIDITPTVPQPAPPSARQAEVARDLVRMVHSQLKDRRGVGSFWASTEALAGGSALVNSIDPASRVDTAIRDGRLLIRGSRRLAGPLWLNVEADVPSSAAGMPPVRLKVGSLPLGETVSRLAMQAAHAVVRWRGIDIPPYDSIVRQLRIQPNGVSASLYLPVGRGNMGAIAALARDTADPVATAAIYCRLSRMDAQVPSDDIAVAAQRAFSAPAGDLTPIRFNHAALVALGMWADKPRVGDLAGNAQSRVDRCARPARPQQLHGREDLAKHWAISAALAATSSEGVTQAVGQWKELADSRPGGSGFSFIDLAADRAGMMAGQRAIQPASANALRDRMRAASPATLLPLGALALSEGLSEAEFIRRYTNVESRAYGAAVARIDRILSGEMAR